MIAKKLPYNIEPLVVIESNNFQKIIAEMVADTNVQVEEVKNTTHLPIK
jgi:hypothetical protein